MPKDFYVDRTTGNFYPDRLVEGADFTAQSLWIRLSLWLRDWFLDTSKGTPWELGLSEQRWGELYAHIRTITLGTHGITEILVFTPVTTGRRLDLDLRAATIYGEDVTFSGSFGT